MKASVPIYPTKITSINEVVSTYCKDRIVKYFHLKKLAFSHSSEDHIQFRYITSGYVLLRLCKMVEIARCFGVTPDSVKYYTNKLRLKGENDFFEPRPKKLTKQIEEYARSEFRKHYRVNNRRYNSDIRKKIRDKFNTKLSGEALRSIFNEEKQKIIAENYKIIPGEFELGILAEKADGNQEPRKGSDKVAKRDKSDGRRVSNVLGIAKSTEPSRPRKVYI